MTDADFEKLPETSKVRIFEADDLLKRIESKISSNFSDTVVARYQVIKEYHSEEIREKKGSELRRILNLHERIIILLEELSENELGQ